MSILRKIVSVVKKAIIATLLIAVVVFVIVFVSDNDGDEVENSHASGQNTMRDVDTVLAVVNDVLDNAPEIRMSRNYVDKKCREECVGLTREQKKCRDRTAELLYECGNDLLLNGDSLYHKRDEGMELLDCAGGLGFVPAWSELGFLHKEKGFTTGDFSRSVAYLKAAAALGEPDAMGGLAEIYWFGLGVSQDRSRAVEWAERAIETRRAAGVLDSYYYGLAYLSGEGNLPVDFKRAFKLFTKGAEAELYCISPGLIPDKRVLIYYQLGIMYMNGNGIPVDMGRAHWWFAKCSEAKGKSDQPEWKTAVRRAAGLKKSIEDEIEKSFREAVVEDEVICKVRKIAAVFKQSPNTDISIETLLESDSVDAGLMVMDIKTNYEIIVGVSEITAELRIKQIEDVKIPVRTNKLCFVKEDDRWVAKNASEFLKRIYLVIKSHYRRREGQT